jgi:hypothetical protein
MNLQWKHLINLFLEGIKYKSIAEAKRKLGKTEYYIMKEVNNGKNKRLPLDRSV